MKHMFLFVATAGLTLAGRVDALKAGVPDQLSLEAKKRFSECVTAIQRERPRPVPLNQQFSLDRMRNNPAHIVSPTSPPKPMNSASMLSLSGGGKSPLLEKLASNVSQSLHPDTAYVRNSCEGPIRHIYSYTSSGRLTVDQKEQLIGNVWEILSRESWTYDPAGQLIASEAAYHGVVTYRQSLSYDTDRRVTGDQREAYNFETGELEWTSRQTAAYDASGNTIFTQCEAWSETEPESGWRRGSLYNDQGLCVADSTAQLKGSSWEMDWRSQSTYDLSGRWVSSCADHWYKGEWVPSMRDTAIYAEDGPQYCVLEESRTDQGWANSGRVTVSYDHGVRTETDLFERWENESWAVESRYIFYHDELSGLRSSLAQDWTGNQWQKTFFWYEVSDMDGRILSQADSSWSDGQLMYCTAQSGEYSGEGTSREFLHSSRSERWNRGRLIDGRVWKYTYDWMQRQISYEQDLFDSLKDAWFPELLIRWGYDTTGRLVSLMGFRWTNSSWFQSDNTSSGFSVGFTIQDYIGNSFAFDLFAEVRFAYQQPASAVAAGNATIPGECVLMQNYPNPFNAATNIGYSVGAVGRQPLVTTRVRLTVYDLLGREVAVLVDEEKKPGSYAVQWNAVSLASGVYVYRMTLGEFVQTHTMLLIK
jgi:hypothetical protein